MTSAHYLDTPVKRALSERVPGEGQDGLFTQSWYPICLASAANPHFVRGFDFLGGREAYKYEWGAGDSPRVNRYLTRVCRERRM